jgi:sortase A
VKRVWRWLPVLLVGLGVWQLGGGLYIHAKAALAQHLMEDAWDRTLAGEEQARPWPWADTWPVARLEVPQRGIDHIVLAGASGSSLAFGPGHVDGTAAPGQHGNTVVGGHRDTHFRFLEHLEPGDEVRVQAGDGSVTTYRVGGSRVVEHDRAGIELSTDTPQLTLVTCYPFDAVAAGGPLRYVVEAEVVL